MTQPPEAAAAWVPYEEVPHTADRSLRIRGRDWPDLFANAAHGMNSIMGPGPTGTDIEREVVLEALDLESLLVAWLSELAFWAETELLVFSQFEFRRLSREALSAHVRGGKTPLIERHVKAVTFHGLSITPEAGGWVTTVVFDV
jgi:SHS2 domain-containing protein